MPREQLYVPKELSFPILITDIDVMRQTKTNLDNLEESSVNLPESGSGPTRFCILNKRPHQGYSWWRVDRPKYKSHRDQKRFGQRGGHLCPNVLKRKQGSNWTLIKLKIQAAHQKKQIHDILVNARKKLDVQPAIPCVTQSPPPRHQRRKLQCEEKAGGDLQH